jgi:hypothetical protein
MAIGWASVGRVPVGRYYHWPTGRVRVTADRVEVWSAVAPGSVLGRLDRGEVRSFVAVDFPTSPWSTTTAFWLATSEFWPWLIFSRRVRADLMTLGWPLHPGSPVPAKAVLDHAAARTHTIAGPLPASAGS